MQQQNKTQLSAAAAAPGCALQTHTMAWWHTVGYCSTRVCTSVFIFVCWKEYMYKQATFQIKTQTTVPLSYCMKQHVLRTSRPACTQSARVTPHMVLEQLKHSVQQATGTGSLTCNYFAPSQASTASVALGTLDAV